MKNKLLVILSGLFLLQACDKDMKNNPSPGSASSGWLVPMDDLVINKDAHDIIPAIDQPAFVQIGEQNLKPDDEVLVYQSGNQIKIYSVNTIWHHEIINDESPDSFFSVSYCPITGSGIAWDRAIGNNETTFGVSGNLYNSNLVPYDRRTESYWSQMTLKGIKGSMGGAELQPEFLLHTIYATAIAGYPDAMVLTDPANGHVCDSICQPGGNNKTGTKILSDYFGIVVLGDILLFDRAGFTGNMQVIQTLFRGQKLVIAGNRELELAVAFRYQGVKTFIPEDDQLPVVMSDQEGNKYDMMGNIVDGPKTGQRLVAPFSYSAKEFAWISFFDEIAYFSE
jgi:hypothetical protein